MPRRTLVIVNPSSGNGRTGRRWSKVEAALRDRLGPFEVELTKGPRDAERIAREGVRSGVERLIVAGGDGTLSEVVSGLLGADLGGFAEIAPLPLGTGGDFIRNLDLPRDLEAAVAALETGTARRADAARVHFRTVSGEETSVHFLNVTSFGISGEVIDRVNRGSKFLGGGISYLVGTIRGAARYRPQPVRLRVDGEVVHEAPLVMAAVANGCWFGGGMKVAPEARIDDGLLDVVVTRAAPMSQLVAHLPRIYSGRHLESPEVSCFRGRVIEAESLAEDVLLEIDGESLGRLPLRIEVLPGAVALLGP